MTQWESQARTRIEEAKTNGSSSFVYRCVGMELDDRVCKFAGDESVPSGSYETR
jgi:hypothetical protein